MLSTFEFKTSNDILNVILFFTKNNYLFTLSINSETVPKYGLKLFHLGTELAPHVKKGCIAIKASYFFQIWIQDQLWNLETNIYFLLKGCFNCTVN